MSAIKVLIVDDHPLVRIGIRTQLEKTTDIEVVGEAGNGHEALQLARELMPDVILLDVGLPGLSGFEVVQKLVQEETPVRVLVLSAHDDIHYIQGLLKLGVAGYLVKDEMMSTILEAIRSVARGEQGWISRRVAAQLSQWQRRENEKVGKLSQRELEVLEALVNGKTNQEIGLLLGISEKTIEKHLDGIFVKLGVSSRVEAAVYATREGWFGEA